MRDGRTGVYEESIRRRIFRYTRRFAGYLRRRDILLPISTCSTCDGRGLSADVWQDHLAHHFREADYPQGMMKFALGDDQVPAYIRKWVFEGATPDPELQEIGVRVAELALRRHIYMVYGFRPPAWPVLRINRFNRASIRDRGDGDGPGPQHGA